MFGQRVFTLVVSHESRCLNRSTGTAGLHQPRDRSKLEKSLWHQMLQGNGQHL